MSPSHNKPLDGLRLVAFLLVFAHHAFWHGEHTGFLLVRYGNWGVQIFFVLSGFLVGRQLLELAHVEAPLWSRFKVFYARRALRIFPVYYLLLALYSLSRLFLPAAMGRTWWRDLPWNLSYTSNIEVLLFGTGAPSYIHLWSLSVEEQFYLLVPLALLCLSRRAVARLCMAAIAGVVLVRFFAALPAGLTWWSLPVLQFHAFGFGILAAIFDLEGHVGSMSTRLFVRIGCLLGAVYLLGLLGVIDTGAAQLAGVLHFTGPWAFAAWVLWLWRSPHTGLGRALALAPLAYLGKISYALYLFHPFVIHSLRIWLGEHSWVLPPLVRSGGELAITMMLAALSWHAFELPLNRLKSRLRYPAAKTVHRPVDVALKVA